VRLQPLDRESTFHAIQAQLRRYILDNNLQPGDVLPPANMMAKALKVSPASFREALRSLESLGVVETRHGVGTFVRAYDLQPILENLSFSLLFERDNLRELVQVREAMEVGLISDVIMRIDDKELDQIAAILDRMRSADGEDDGQNDRLFHQALYRCLNNHLVLHLIDIFWIVYHDLSDRLLIPKPERPWRWERHAPIYEAIRRKDTESARQAIVAHFDEVKERIGMSESLKPSSLTRKITV